MYIEWITAGLVISVIFYGIYKLWKKIDDYEFPDNDFKGGV